MTGPLAGVTIVEFDAIGPVPFAAMMLGDMGAEIVRIVRPGRGTSASADGPALGRGRRSVELDLKTQAGRDDALSLVAKADALLEGARPGVMERLGLGPADCHAANPALVYGRMTGWGQTGPLAQEAGHDINYLALTGALHAIGPADRPVPPLNLVGDYGGGAMMLALGVVAGVLAARGNGQGRVVDAAMTDGAALLCSLFYTLHAAGQWTDRREANMLDGAAPFYRCYACADGKHVAVGAIEPQFFAKLLAGLGLADDWRAVQHDRTRWTEMAAAFEAEFAKRPRNAWADHFAGTDACVTPVLDFAEAPNHPHNVARGTFVDGFPAPAPRFGAV
ncbi:MAG TPA: CaiB/BaiF CoA-transferase family protein [Sphingomonas sp.]|nr:CaiB/BaiF CoA-transferase family protein [Sphingomonas sp.]